MFNPPASPTNGAEFTYGNVVWQYQNPPGVWNIKDGTLVGTDGVGVSGFRIDGTNLKFYYVYPDGATSAEINLGTVAGGGVGGGLTFRASNNTTDSVEPGETLTVTGAGSSVRTTVSGNTMTVDIRTAGIGVSGLASFGNTNFIVGADGGVTPKNITVKDPAGRKADLLFTLGGEFTVTGGTGVKAAIWNDTNRVTEEYPQGFPGGIEIYGADASYSSKGIASFNSSQFAVSNGAVSLASGVTGNTITGPNQAILITKPSAGNTLVVDARLAEPGKTGVASFNDYYFSVNNGAVSLSGNFQYPLLGGKTGDTVVGTGAVRVSRTNNQATVDSRFGSYSETGVASFDPRHFGIGSTGHLTLSGPYQVTGDTVTGGASTSAIKVYRSGNVATVDVRVAEAGTSGVASFNPTDFNISSGGAVSFAGSNMLRVKDSQNNSDTVVNYTQTLTITGGPGILTRANSTTDTLSIVGATATYSALGIASFDSTHFAVASGAVSLSGSYGVVGVTGIGFGNDTGLVGKINITAGTNITITESGKTITINSSASGSGLPQGLSEQANRLVYTNQVAGEGLTHSANLLFDGAAVTFGTSTLVNRGVYSRPRESVYISDSSGEVTTTLEINPSNGFVQFLKVQFGSSPKIKAANTGWSTVRGESEAVLVFLQSVNAVTATFDDSVIIRPKPRLCGTTAGIDEISIVRVSMGANGGLTFGFRYSSGLTGPGYPN